MNILQKTISQRLKDKRNFERQEMLPTPKILQSEPSKPDITKISKIISDSSIPSEIKVDIKSVCKDCPSVDIMKKFMKKNLDSVFDTDLKRFQDMCI